jgi:hypothetical protein
VDCWRKYSGALPGVLENAADLGRVCQLATQMVENIERAQAREVQLTPAAV